jgi:hypothetical protein
MKYLKSAILVVACLTFSLSVFALDKKSELALEYLKLTKTEESINRTIDIFINQISSQNPQIDKEKLRVIYAKSMGWEAIKDPIVKIVSNAYSEEDLEAIINFCKTKHGAAFTEKSPTISAELSELVAGNLYKAMATDKSTESPKPPLDKNPSTHQKPKKSTVVFKPKGDRFLVWYDPSVWRPQKESSDPDKTSFTHKDGDVGVIVIAERVEIPLETLKEVAINNAMEAAPDMKVTFEENRVVNGRNILCMKMQGTVQSIKFNYDSYYYAGKAGVIQCITYAPNNLYREYESDMSDFLDGLVINE